MSKLDEAHLKLCGIEKEAIDVNFAIDVPLPPGYIKQFKYPFQRGKAASE